MMAKDAVSIEISFLDFVTKIRSRIFQMFLGYGGLSLLKKKISRIASVTVYKEQIKKKSKITYQYMFFIFIVEHL